MLHIATCCWIWLEIEISDNNDSPIQKFYLRAIQFGHGELISMCYNYYVNAMYFMTTTMTTVGYGDTVNKGKNIHERIFLFIIIFCGIAMFTMITE